jgi:hypothetical protein
MWRVIRMIDVDSKSSIRTIIDEKGLDPIWVHLIKQFGSIMYLKGLESSRPQLRSPLRKSA